MTRPLPELIEIARGWPRECEGALINELADHAEALLAAHNHLLALLEGEARVVGQARAEGERAGRAAEREACARVVENYPWPTKTAESLWGIERSMIAAAIRSRSEGERHHSDCVSPGNCRGCPGCQGVKW